MYRYLSTLFHVVYHFLQFNFNYFTARNAQLTICFFCCFSIFAFLNFSIFAILNFSVLAFCSSPLLSISTH